MSLIYKVVSVGLIALCGAQETTQTTVNAPSQTSYTPISFGLRTAPIIDGLLPYSNEFTLTSASPVLTLDYGADVAGFPYFEVTSFAEAGTQVELKYSEQFQGLNLAYGDGPWLYALGLMNSFRTETFNITSIGTTQSFFIQGGQRWQTITLLSNSSITISNIGFAASVEIQPLNDLTGSFTSSKSIYNELWGLGARSVQASCVEAGSQPSTWEISDDAAFIRGQYPGFSALGTNEGDYNMSFTTKITKGGTGWKVAAGPNGGYGAYFVLTSNGPQYLSTDTSVVPPNSLIAGYGFSIINWYLQSATPLYYSNPIPVLENEWYRVSTEITPSGYNVSVNGTQFALIPYTTFLPWVNAGFGGTNLITTGTWGFGPFLDQVAYFKDVEVVAQNGTLIYTNPLTSTDILQEYSVASNEYAVCLDGAKRDREIWIGDFAHTSREIAASTGKYDFIQSMIEFTFLGQFTSGSAVGLVPIQDSMGSSLKYQATFYPSQYGETDYQLFFLLTIGDYYVLTGDTAFLSTYWSGTKLVVAAIINMYLDPTTSLLINGSWFTAQGFQSATAPTALFAIALKQLITLATALFDNTTADQYTTLYNNISLAINTHLWNPSIGAYSLALSNPSDTSLLATAFTIRAGIANTSQIESSIASLSTMFYEIGYKDSTVIGNGPTTQLSPNIQGFLLESLFIAHKSYNISSSIIVPVLKNLLDTFWPKMVEQNEYYTGCPWEYLYPDGSPGIGMFTSLCHPWGGAPTYVFTDYLLGVRRVHDEGTGEYEWVFDPAYEIAKELGVLWANGTVPLKGGGYIKAYWSYEENGGLVGSVEVVEAPEVKVLKIF